jgi:hypothetical protein
LASGGDGLADGASATCRKQPEQSRHRSKSDEVKALEIMVGL